MKIKLTGTRQVWFDGQAQDAGYVGEVDAAVGENLIALGMAVKVEEEKPKASTKKA